MNDDGCKLALSRTLQDAGYEIDWNKLMHSLSATIMPD